jgi:hypothetical protein
LVFGDVVTEESIIVDGQEEFEISKILKHRVARGRLEYLCAWKGYGNFENSWLPVSELGNAQELITEYE